ncbi:hypothetical protein GCK72_008181 [Caenorhabditis remanei]|uniref:Uncharacterized protein n=1 Tax=Caenorhabditis remanei TaxID=31234 RepID=A0A6A5GZI8_CAERE|nr:hypothetical protein GCK72_008181 [Caenorhabditis remanei]KAF1759936.1 hypothetical protein GCK72_008181 [Caenorhabditis remanei]
MLEVFIEMAPETKYKVRERVRQELEKPSRFVGYAAELGHCDLLNSFSPKISKSIDDSRRRLEVETVERLRRSGYLENLGTPLDELVRAQIESIREILPHFSSEIIHVKSLRGGTTTSGASTMTSSEGYTGGRDRQMKERHKSDHKQRGADRKKRGAY